MEYYKGMDTITNVERVKHAEYGEGVVLNRMGARPQLAWMQEDSVFVEWDKAPRGMHRRTWVYESTVEPA
jgi:hypothetical protein